MARLDHRSPLAQGQRVPRAGIPLANLARQRAPEATSGMTDEEIEEMLGEDGDLSLGRPKALDLFCGAGGVSVGLQRAGFDVTGVDIRPQPRHRGGTFIQADALTLPLDGFDFIWASPPCQAYCALRHLYPQNSYPDLVAPIRERLRAGPVPVWVIENVPGAPLLNPVQFCGSAFALRVRRHRLFEATFDIRERRCCHRWQGRPIDVSGTGGRRINRRSDDHGGNTNKPRNLGEARAAMGIDWMNRNELSQAIPPAYSEFIGKQAIQFLNREVLV